MPSDFQRWWASRTGFGAFARPILVAPPGPRLQWVPDGKGGATSVGGEYRIERVELFVLTAGGAVIGDYDELEQAQTRADLAEPRSK